jgi:hypothetical protein
VAPQQETAHHQAIIMMWWQLTGGARHDEPLRARRQTAEKNWNTIGTIIWSNWRSRWSQTENIPRLKRKTYRRLQCPLDIVDIGLKHNSKRCTTAS